MRRKYLPVLRFAKRLRRMLGWRSVLFRSVAIAAIVLAILAARTMVAQSASYQISAADPDFSIAVLPDTQFYNSSYSWVFMDQVNWIVANKESLRIKLVVGVGDIIDGGGYPVDSDGNIVGACDPAPPPNWQTQWKSAQAAINVLASHGIYYQATIGNHDYDCQANRPHQPRGATNYFYYFGPQMVHPTAYILDSFGNRTPSFYKTITIGSTTYMVLSLEFFPRKSTLDTANRLISSFAGPVIVVTHSYLSYDGSGPTFSSTHLAGTAYPLCSGFPTSIYSCQSDSLSLYQPEGGGTDGIGLWYRLLGIHPNILMVLSGHVRTPNPGNYPDVPTYNGTGYVNCGVQSWTTLCSNPYRPIQILSDFQGQGQGGFFGYGYLRVLTVSPSQKKISVFTYSPSIAISPGKFPQGIPAYKTDSHNCFSLRFPNTFGGPDREVTHITSPLDGAHVPLTFAISARARGSDNASHMQIFVDGISYADYPGATALPTGTQVTLPTSGTHRVEVQTYNYTRLSWVKSVIYVRNP